MKPLHIQAAELVAEFDSRPRSDYAEWEVEGVELVRRFLTTELTARERLAVELSAIEKRPPETGGR